MTATYVRPNRTIFTPTPLPPPQYKVTRYHRTLVNKWKIANTHSDTILLSPQNSGPEKRRLFLFSQSEAYIWTNSIDQIRWVETKQALELKVRNGNPDGSKGKAIR